jgi:hypothetical protein
MLVIGNGESRISIDINKIQEPKIGCNAIYRDYHVDHLICVDRRMVQEALKNDVNQTSYVYTRDNWVKQFNSLRVRTVPPLPYKGDQRWDEPFQWGSGPYAVLLSAKLCKGSTVRLVGFDLHSTTSTVNNVYKGTSNYDSAEKRPVDPRYWIHQIGKVFELYRKRNFVIYQTDDWSLPDNWKFPNVSVDNVSNL